VGFVEDKVEVLILLVLLNYA